MSVKLNRPRKPDESQKDSNFTGKTINYPGFEPGTSGLAVGSHNHCTIWVGQHETWKKMTCSSWTDAATKQQYLPVLCSRPNGEQYGESSTSSNVRERSFQRRSVVEWLTIEDIRKMLLRLQEEEDEVTRLDEQNRLCMANLRTKVKQIKDEISQK
jgi:hypothetical protein